MPTWPWLFRSAQFNHSLPILHKKLYDPIASIHPMGRLRFLNATPLDPFTTHREIIDISALLDLFHNYTPCAPLAHLIMKLAETTSPSLPPRPGVFVPSVWLHGNRAWCIWDLSFNVHPLNYGRLYVPNFYGTDFRDERLINTQQDIAGKLKGLCSFQISWNEFKIPRQY